MINKVLATIKKYNMLLEGENVIVGFSGGADSTCLLHILKKLEQTLKIRLYAIHVHHGIRDKEADRDADFVKEFCEKYDISYEIVYRDICKEAKEKGISTEEAGRSARYEIFNKKLNVLKCQKIATAHHINDQVETVMMNLIRGSGLKGITGIQPVRDNIIRPLIDVTRQEIEEYCLNNSINFMEDYTNKLDLYTRNKVRNQLIPYIEEQFNPKFILQVANMANMLREEEEFIQNEVNKAYKLCEKKNDNKIVILDNNILKTMDDAIKRRIFREALKKLNIGLKDLEYKHIQDMIMLTKKNTGKMINLPNNIIVKKNYNDIHIYPLANSQANHIDTSWEYSLKKQQMTLYAKEILSTITINIVKDNDIKNFPKNLYTKWFDYDRIKGNLKLRCRKPGDYIYLKGLKGRKKLKNFFIDLKIPKEERDKIPLIADGSNILWIIGYRTSHYYEITNNTTCILEVKIYKEAKNEY